jgi:hypothetical protein
MGGGSVSECLRVVAAFDGWVFWNVVDSLKAAFSVL